MISCSINNPSGTFSLDTLYGDSYDWSPFDSTVNGMGRDFITPDPDKLPDEGDYSRAYFYNQDGLRYAVDSMHRWRWV